MKLDDVVSVVRDACEARSPVTAARDALTWRGMVEDWLFKGVEVAALFRGDGRFVRVFRSPHEAKSHARALANSGTTDIRIKRITF